eukprot:NODE_504_length_6695_cov_1.218163.p2 type:complete len:443 gc:universal NODE_504_length_6695_cov_1.218163:1530-202(-)
MSLNGKLVFSVLSACVGTFHFGYHLSELNAPKQFLQCQNSSQSNCIEMSDSLYSLASAIFTIGGFCGTLVCRYANCGRRAQLMISGLFIMLGSIFMVSSSYLSLLIIGRFIVGVWGGLALFNTPVYISEISPIAMRGILGTFSQFAINIGIFIASLIGYCTTEWRLIVGFPIITGFLQVFFVYFAPESPKYLFMKSVDNQEASESILKGLRPKNIDVAEEMDGWKQHDSNEASITFKQFINDRMYSKLLLGLALAHSSIQLSGINIVFFYSVSILQSLFGSQALFWSLMIAVYNIFTTFLSSVFIERVGRKKLMLTSLAWVTLSQLGLMLSLYFQSPVLAFLFFISIVTGFSLGLCVVPYILIGELFDGSTVDYANGVANPVNWGCNFIVSFAFLPLTSIIQSYIFLIFVAYGIFAFFMMMKFVPETKGITPTQLHQKLRNQ